MSIGVGDKAPDFSLPALGREDKIHLSDVLANKKVLLAFYPKDNTSG